MAHLVEHVTFLGSTKREALHGTGARSNAYTDFHHTVFHVHAPQKSMGWGNSALLPKVRISRQRGASNSAQIRAASKLIWHPSASRQRRGDTD